MTTCLGFDIGGANIKVASTEGMAVHQPFPMWKAPQTLGSQLVELLSEFPTTLPIGVTMTGELADCFESKQDGVNYIVKTCQETMGERAVFYQNQGQFVTAGTATQSWLQTAAANWHALTTWVAQQVESGFLFDIGSTTTDIIPFQNCTSLSIGKSDLERLCHQELIYTGVGRSPISCMLSSGAIRAHPHIALAQELFAFMQDAYLVLGRTHPEPQNQNTADGKPLTRNHSRQRIARLLCADRSELINQEIEQIAQAAVTAQHAQITTGLQKLLTTHPDLPKRFVVSGQGEWLARDIALTEAGAACEIVTFAELINKFLGPCDTGDSVANPSIDEESWVTLSDCAPAFAVACLLKDGHDR
ncbi:MAG: hypothetical protein MK106_15335 [Mariniblastus sp.]|nr:hypothetical protein [Mariniblastus sp.]